MTAAEKGAPGAGTSGSAEEVQQIRVTGEQAKYNAAEYDYTIELVAIEEALTRICEYDPAFADHRRRLVDYPYFGVVTDKFVINVTIRKHDGGTA